MANVLDAKYARFDLTDVAYTTIGDTEIELSILTPKDLPPGKYPTILRYHGGYLITGSRLHAPWFPQWLLDFALDNKAIIISPDYRLLTEANGNDIMSDIDSLFTYMCNDLPFKLSPLGLHADLSSLLVCGESAGGYLAMQSALLHHNDSAVRFKAAISAYGMLDMRSDFFTKPGEKRILNLDPVPRSVYDKHLHSIKSGQVPNIQVAAEPPDRNELAFSVVCAGLHKELLGDESRMYPLENLDRIPKNKLPAMWLFHGTGDTAVPVEASKVFAEKAEKLNDGRVRLTLEDGQEHGFDEEVTIKTNKWMKDGLEWVQKHWP